MSKIKFLVGRILGMNYRQLFDTVKKCHKKSGKNSIWLFFDIVYCGLKYQAGYIDYMNAAMYNMSKAQKEDVITRGVNNQYVVKYNDFDYIHYFQDKAQFNKKFEKYLKRDWVLIERENQRDEFEKFIADKADFIIKPIDGTHGDGVKKLPAVMESFDESKAVIPYLAEERIIQVKEMSELNPTSVNTIRAITFVKDGEVTLIAAYLRMGRDGVVDNFCNGGMLTPIDVETGVISCPAVDGENNAYSAHPITGKSIVGFKVPQFDEVRKMVLDAATFVPEVRYVGWDVAISEKGPCLIEGNEYPGHVFYNFPEHHPDGTGSRHVFEKIMN